jgi:hypothetical protein
MSFRPSLRSVESGQSGHSFVRATALVARRHWKTGLVLGGAAIVGGVAGTGSLSVSSEGVASVSGAARSVAADLGLVRKRVPVPGDSWSSCTEARSAGATPIYVGEPGYREGLDYDGDGVACEAEGHNSHRKRRRLFKF